ncbi:MAG: hypothetical protein CO075_03675, partial [Candidatus Moranbacteria bacterium CG_4_9_14_0_8_um_filter_41_43]
MPEQSIQREVSFPFLGEKTARKIRNRKETSLWIRRSASGRSATAGRLPLFWILCEIHSNFVQYAPQIFEIHWTNFECILKATPIPTDRTRRARGGRKECFSFGVL